MVTGKKCFTVIYLIMCIVSDLKNSGSTQNILIFSLKKTGKLYIIVIWRINLFRRLINIMQKEKQVALLKILLETKLIKHFLGESKIILLKQFFFFFSLYRVKLIACYCRGVGAYHLFLKSYYVSKSIELSLVIIK